MVLNEDAWEPQQVSCPDIWKEPLYLVEKMIEIHSYFAYPYYAREIWGISFSSFSNFGGGGERGEGR